MAVLVTINHADGYIGFTIIELLYYCKLLKK